MSYAMYFFISLFSALLFTPIVKKLAIKIGAVDKPNYRKVHQRIMPRMGGLAIYLSFFISFLLFLPITSESIGVLIGGTIIVGTGILDDKFQISPKVKLMGQLLAALVVVYTGLEINFINLPFDGYIDFKWLSIPITLFWIIGITNAINLIDGLDGLAAGVSAIAMATTAIMSIMMGNTLALMISVILLGSILGFLFFNFHPAKIFMGDTGSLFLGFNLAALSILGFKQVTLIAFIIPILILGVPISDTLYAIIRRILNKKPITEPDKNHLHHCLLSMGYSHRKTVLIIYGISIFFAAVAILFSQSTLWMAFIIISVLLIILEIGSEIIGLKGEKNKPLIRCIKIIKMRWKILIKSANK